MDPLFSKSHSELKTITKTNQPTKQQNPPKLIHCLPVFLSSRGYREFRVSDAILSRGALLSLPLSTQTSIESKTPLIQYLTAVTLVTGSKNFKSRQLTLFYFHPTWVSTLRHLLGKEIIPYIYRKGVAKKRLTSGAVWNRRAFTLWEVSASLQEAEEPRRAAFVWSLLLRQWSETC